MCVKSSLLCLRGSRTTRRDQFESGADFGLRNLKLNLEAGFTAYIGLVLRGQNFLAKNKDNEDIFLSENKDNFRPKIRTMRTFLGLKNTIRTFQFKAQNKDNDDILSSKTG